MMLSLIVPFFTLVGCPASKPAEVAPAPLDADRARQVADELATGELRRVEVEWQQRDPKVRLPLSDYAVTLTERTLDGGVELFAFRYEFRNPAVDFALWSGHGMHFVVLVDQATGQPELVPGE